ncbi:TPA: AAA family ATPase [Elizabethkingia anophelis]
MFKVFNKIGEHKILSLFLMGDSGVGKTEVARAIHKALNGQSKMAKINFGNYSSDNSLNSLIGSPRGYIGSDDGEIFIRVAESDTGIILIDEFEKSNSTLFNYFLDVLENGKLVSSLAHEIDLNGFIIIFTSNISKEDFKKVISPELRSRFDYKGYFSILKDIDKLKYVEFRIDSIIRKFNKNVANVLDDDFKYDVFLQINVTKYKNMRDINKAIKRIFVEKLKQKVIK